MDHRTAVAATVSHDAVNDRWLLTLEGPAAETLEDVEVPWDGGGGFLEIGLNYIGPLLNERGLAYTGTWIQYGERWTVAVNPLADWWRGGRGGNC